MLGPLRCDAVIPIIAEPSPGLFPVLRDTWKPVESVEPESPHVGLALLPRCGWISRPDDAVTGELTVSRAFGDFYMGDLKKRSVVNGVFEGPLIAEPEVMIPVDVVPRVPAGRLVLGI